MGWTYSIHAEMRNTHKKLSENTKWRDYLGDLGTDGRIILQWI
jgi:hypothetical protein